MYAVDLFLDEKSSEYIKSIWRELSKNKIGSGLDNVKLLEPHITLAIYDEIDDMGDFVKRLEDFSKGLKSMKSRFDILGSFPTTGTCLISPMITEEILSMHRDFYKVMKDYDYSAREFYKPERWNPHCSLASGLSLEELKKVLDYSLNVFVPFEGAFYGIGLYDLKTDKLGKVIKSKRLF